MIERSTARAENQQQSGAFTRCQYQEPIMSRVAWCFSKRAVISAAWLTCTVAIGAEAIAQSDSASSIRAVPLILTSIDESQRVVLHGNTRPEALRPQFDRGAVDDSFPLNGMQ